MKVKELIEELRKFDGSLEIEVDEEIQGLHDMFIMSVEEMEPGKVTISARLG